DAVVQPFVKDSLYPLRISMRNSRSIPTRKDSAILESKTSGSTITSNSVREANARQNPSQNWCTQGSKMFRNVAAHFRRIFQKHLLRRAP
ncbi:hypothetical protein L9F63_004426, partial [Diploptera punctata]